LGGDQCIKAYPIPTQTYQPRTGAERAMDDVRQKAGILMVSATFISYDAVLNVLVEQ
jgi:hypothetical protein